MLMVELSMNYRLKKSICLQLPTILNSKSKKVNFFKVSLFLITILSYFVLFSILSSGNASAQLSAPLPCKGDPYVAYRPGTATPASSNIVVDKPGVVYLRNNEFTYCDSKFDIGFAATTWALALDTNSGNYFNLDTPEGVSLVGVQLSPVVVDNAISLSISPEQIDLALARLPKQTDGSVNIPVTITYSAEFRLIDRCSDPRYRDQPNCTGRIYGTAKPASCKDINIIKNNKAYLEDCYGSAGSSTGSFNLNFIIKDTTPDEDDVCPPGTSYAGALIPDEIDAASECNICDEGTTWAGSTIPAGEDPDVWCNETNHGEPGDGDPTLSMSCSALGEGSVRGIFPIAAGTYMEVVVYRASDGAEVIRVGMTADATGKFEQQLYGAIYNTLDPGDMYIAEIGGDLSGVSDSILPCGDGVDENGICPDGSIPDVNNDCPGGVDSGDACDGAVTTSYNEGPSVIRTNINESLLGAAPTGAGQVVTTHYYITTVGTAADDNGVPVGVNADRTKAEVYTSSLIDADLHTVRGSSDIQYGIQTTTSYLASYTPAVVGQSEIIAVAFQAAVYRPGLRFCDTVDVNKCTQDPPILVSAQVDAVAGRPYIAASPAVYVYAWGPTYTTYYSDTRTFAPDSLKRFQCFDRSYVSDADQSNIDIVGDNEDPASVSFTYSYDIAVEGQGHKRTDQPLQANASLKAEIYVVRRGTTGEVIATATPYTKIGPTDNPDYKSFNTSSTLVAPISASSYPAGTQFCGRLTLTNPTGASYQLLADLASPSYGAGNPKTTKQNKIIGPSNIAQCPKIYDKPYFKVVGGELRAGSPVEGGSCSVSSSASILGNARTRALVTNAPQDGYRGTSSNSIVIAPGELAGLYTDTTPASAIPSGSPLAKALIFANTTSGWGGGFGASSSCRTDYSDPTRQTAYDPSRILSGDEITITSNAQTLNYDLIVANVIIVSPSVTQLGSPDNPVKLYATNYISTCGDDASTFYDACRSKLSVYGSMSANKIYLLRTNGSLRSATAGEASTSNNIAEVFYGDEQPHLGPPNESLGNIDSITSLPPLL
jgi:hypothetical protein